MHIYGIAYMYINIYGIFCYSSPLAHPDLVDIVFNVVEIPGGEGRYRARQGLCSGWLDTISTHLQNTPTYKDEHSVNDLSNQMKDVSLESKTQPKVLKSII